MRTRTIAVWAAGVAGATVLGVSQRVIAADDPADVQEVTVIGSRIPRVNQEGPAPITIINAEQIAADGLTSVPDVLRAITQNAGETQSQQSFNGSDFTPGAQQVDLRGLGPNHTLVLVNGRRIADFPLPFNGKSNFTDISNLPLGMIEKVEVLSGSASAIYGSDAISGVVNFVLKKKADGTTVNYRFGATEDGGGSSQRLTLTSGWSNDKGFDSIFGVELLDQKPLWAFDRSIQDSTADDPTTEVPLARRTFLRYDPDADEYVDPGQATCASLSSLNKGSTFYASRPRYGDFDDALDDYGPGFFCGSEKSVGYGTVISKRRGATGYASMNLAVNDNVQLFADVMASISKVQIFQDTLDWQFEDANGSEDGVFFNDQLGALDSWYRQFTPEEMGGLDRGYIKNEEHTLSITPGVRGTFAGGAWNYEAYFNHSQYRSSVSWPEIVASKANALFLGAQTGVDEDGIYPTFDADIARLYTPLTRAEYDSIATRTNYEPKSQNDYLSFTVNSPSFYSLPAGPIGFAANLEVGTQKYAINPDPLALTHYYYGLLDQDGHGSRNHWGASYEVRVPVVEKLEISNAGRYDRYNFAGGGTGKFTYNAGLEFRPIDTLLLRSYYGTGFRAPDLHYLFAGSGNTHPSATDYFLCRTEEPDEDIGDCSFADEGIVNSRSGNRLLKSESSKSFGAGFVWAPTHGFDISIDYFKIKLKDQVLDMSLDSILRDEADCRLGETTNGTPVDINTPTCQDAIARVARYAEDNPVTPGGLFGVSVNPINVALESTSGVDLALHYRLSTSVGNFSFNGSYTHVNDHSSRQYPGDPTVDQFAVDSGYDIPRSKGSASVSWNRDKWTTTLHGQRLDKLPNWDEEAYIPATYLVNASVQFAWSEAGRVQLAVDNLFDEKPVKDPTYASYPYYDISWFDSVGRSYFLEATYKFGGK